MWTEIKALQDHVYDYPSLPLFVPHCIIMSLALRATLGEQNWRSYSRRHPLSCYLMATLYTFSGGILATVLLAEPALSFLLNAPFVISLTVSWYLVFYSPGDAFVRLIDAMHFRIPLQMAQDFLRMQLALAGVNQIHKLHPEAILYPIVFSVCKSSGFMLLKYLETILSNGFDRAFVVPHHTTKTCILASVLFQAKVLGFISVEMKLLFLMCVMIAITLRLLTAFSDVDPYVGFESLFCAVAFGRTDELAQSSDRLNSKVQSTTAKGKKRE